MQEVVSYIRNFAHKEWKFDNITMFIRFSTREENQTIDLLHLKIVCNCKQRHKSGLFTQLQELHGEKSY